MTLLPHAPEGPAGALLLLMLGSFTEAVRPIGPTWPCTVFLVRRAWCGPFPRLPKRFSTCGALTVPRFPFFLSLSLSLSLSPPPVCPLFPRLPGYLTSPPSGAPRGRAPVQGGAAPRCHLDGRHGPAHACTQPRRVVAASLVGPKVQPSTRRIGPVGYVCFILK